MSPCHNLEPSLVARDSSWIFSVKPNEWMHLSPFYTRMYFLGELSCDEWGGAESHGNGARPVE